MFNVYESILVLPICLVIALMVFQKVNYLLIASCVVVSFTMGSLAFIGEVLHPIMVYASLYKLVGLNQEMVDIEVNILFVYLMLMVVVGIYSYFNRSKLNLIILCFISSLSILSGISYFVINEVNLKYVLWEVESSSTIELINNGYEDYCKNKQCFILDDNGLILNALDEGSSDSNDGGGLSTNYIDYAKNIVANHKEGLGIAAYHNSLSKLHNNAIGYTLSIIKPEYNKDKERIYIWVLDEDIMNPFTSKSKERLELLNGLVVFVLMAIIMLYLVNKRKEYI